MQKTAWSVLSCALCLSQTPLYAEAIEDNSFLVEEAYNQEPGVVQFIQTYQKDKSGDAFYSLTVEVPAPNETHQISFMIPYAHLDAAPAVNGIGDVGLNYRYQLFSNDTVAIAPRLSLLLPTGDDKKGLGTGVLGYQTNWAVSVKVNPSLALHVNIGATFLPGVDNGMDEVDLYGNNSALSLIWLVNDNFNFLVEFVQSSMGVPDGTGVAVESSAIINPGFRYAVNFSSSQLVLGASIPTPALYSKGEASYMAYLSYEPKLW